MALLVSMDKEDFDHLCKRACEVREQIYGKDVYLRGLIEFSNYCRNDCYYCGIRRSNRLADRYRLSENEIVACSDAGYELGFRTFVLQSGEDLSYTTADICRIVSKIRNRHPDCAVTLSIGEGLLRCRGRAVSAPAGNIQPMALQKASPARALHREPQTLSVRPPGDRLSGWVRDYGRDTGADTGIYHRGSSIHAEAGSSDDRNRSLYPPQGYTVSRWESRRAPMS